MVVYHMRRELAIGQLPRRMEKALRGSVLELLSPSDLNVGEWRDKRLELAKTLRRFSMSSLSQSGKYNAQSFGLVAKYDRVIGSTTTRNATYAQLILASIACSS